MIDGNFSMMSVSQEKAALRTRYRTERRERFVEHDFLIVIDTPEIQNASIVGSYFSINDEPSTALLNARLHASGKTVALPALDGEQMSWRIWDGATIDLGKKIPEATGEAIDPHTFDAILVPALRVDRRGYRLGQGGGYFDRALADLRCWSCALIHPDEISSIDLPTEPWDVPVRAFATPDMISRIKE